MDSTKLQNIAVKRLRVSQGMTLVEWIDPSKGPQRYWVTPSMIKEEKENFTIVDGPQRGIPFGDDLLDGFEFSVTKEQLLRELRARGLWTYADLLANPNAARGALQSAYGLDLATLIRIANSK